MLGTLLAVLVLLVIGFYALAVGGLGRVGLNEGSELSPPARLLSLGIAIIAFGGAYLVYTRPEASTPALAATPSSPPETRAATAPPAETANADETAKPGDEATAANPAPEAVAEAASSAPSAATAEPAAQEVADEGSGTAGLSAAAAELEEKSRLRRERAARAPAYAGPEAAEPAAREAPAETAQATAPQRVAALVKPTPRKSYSPRSPRNERRATHSGPLLMHVHNTLGRDQQREQLTLMIEGKRVADIEVDDFAPEASIAIELPRPGLLHYRLEGVSEDDRTMRLVGEGCIRVRDGARFAVRRKDGSRKVFLEQQSGRAG